MSGVSRESTSPGSTLPYINLNPFYRGRVRSGCTACRARKVKCDEQRPQCKRCLRSKKECQYQSKSPRNVHAYLRDTRLSVGSSKHAGQDNSGSQGGRNVPPTAYADLAAAGVSTEFHVQPAITADSEDVSLMTSQDIYLCTTIDWLAARETLRSLSFDYFLNSVKLPQITSFDPFGWEGMKQRAVELAKQHDSIAAAIAATQLLFRAQENYLPTTNAASQYTSARKAFEQDLTSFAKDFEAVFLNIFLLSLFPMVLLEDVDNILRQSEGPFVELLEVWSLSRRRSPIVSRLAVWLTVMHASARRIGNQGLLSPQVFDLLSDQYDQIPPLSGPAASIFALESTGIPLVKFYVEIQKRSLRIANMTHYHRSRITATDQEEAVNLLTTIKRELTDLWHSRPALMKADANEIHAKFSSKAEPMITAIEASMANFFAEQVEIGRNLSDPMAMMPEAQEALSHIRHLVDNSSSRQGGGHLDPSYLRPLFMYTIESITPEDAAWAVSRMREIRDPVCRSDFFANYAEGLARAQRDKGRRVTVRWFCYQEYGVRPPYM